MLANYKVLNAGFKGRPLFRTTHMYIYGLPKDGNQNKKGSATGIYHTSTGMNLVFSWLIYTNDIPEILP